MHRILPILPVLLLSATPALAAEFKFAPPDGLECTQSLTSSKKTDLKDSESSTKHTRDEVATSVMKMKYEKQADGSYLVRAKVESGEMKRDGQVLDDPMAKMMVGREFVMKVSPAGELRDVEGYEEMIDALMVTLPPETQEMLGKVLTAKALRDREAAEWNGRIGGFVGRKADAGESWETEEQFDLPSGPIKFTSLTRIAKAEPRGDKHIVTIHFAYDADVAAAQKLMEEVDKVLESKGKQTGMKFGEPAIKGAGERVVDANTMTIERERVHRTITAPVDVPQQGKMTLVSEETRSYDYKCNK